MAVTTTPAFELDTISMHYGYLKVLDEVSVRVAPGEVMALLGDNGAGKSTLLKVMSGAHQPTSGTIRVHGTEHDFHSPRRAAEVGVEMVYQDLALVDAMDISSNLMLGRERMSKGLRGVLGFIDLRAMRREAQHELDALGIRTAPVTRPVEMLSSGQRQIVAIARAAARLPDEGVLLMDEPTAALGHEQTELVEELIRTMAARGIAVVIVTHNLPLVMNVADRIVVLNRGRKVADIETSRTDKDRVVSWIIGASVQEDMAP
jgi:simple sugar transport system ATP-binding protein